MRSGLKISVALIAIVIGLVTITKIVGYAELVVGVLSFTFGIMALIWVHMARNSLSPGSTLRSYTNYFLVCLVFLMLFSLTLTAERFSVERGYVSMLVYLEYGLLTLVYLTFVAASYKIWNIGQEFGFEKESRAIKQLMNKKK